MLIFRDRCTNRRTIVVETVDKTLEMDNQRDAQTYFCADKRKWTDTHCHHIQVIIMVIWWSVQKAKYLIQVTVLVSVIHTEHDCKKYLSLGWGNGGRN